MEGGDGASLGDAKGEKAIDKILILAFYADDLVGGIDLSFYQGHVILLSKVHDYISFSVIIIFDFAFDFIDDKVDWRKDTAQNLERCRDDIFSQTYASFGVRECAIEGEVGGDFAIIA